MESDDESLPLRPRSQNRGTLHKSGTKGQRAMLHRKTQSLDQNLAEDKVRMIERRAHGSGGEFGTREASA